MRGRRGGRTRNWALCALTIGMVTLGGVASAGAVGILPPANPPGNIAPENSDYLTSIDDARAVEGVGTMAVSETQIDAMPVDEQVFVLINRERVDRGLPPIEYLTSQLNSVALAGANDGDDPGFPTDLTGGAPVEWGGSIWAGGLTNVFEADYYWMYDDGYGGLLGVTSNAACSLLSSSECWGHRDIILHSFPTCNGGAPVLSMGAAYSSSGYEGGSIAAVLISTCSAPTDILMSWSSVQDQLVAAPHVIGIAALTNGSGYWEAESNGVVGAFGSAVDYGDLSTQTLNAPITGIAATPDGKGYWLVASDGGIFSFGDAKFYGSTGALHLNKPIVGMSATNDGKGYWLVASDGGIFGFGDAAFLGSMGATHLNEPVVGMATDPATGGYWLVASDGGVFSFDAPFFGSTGALHLVKPIVGMAALANGEGYRFEASDGGVFDFGQATFDGSMGGQNLVASVVGMATDLVNGGYWLVAGDGGIFNYGGASFLGRLLGIL
jgi:hypothetical protein